MNLLVAIEISDELLHAIKELQKESNPPLTLEQTIIALIKRGLCAFRCGEKE